MEHAAALCKPDGVLDLVPHKTRPDRSVPRAVCCVRAAQVVGRTPFRAATSTAVVERIGRGTIPLPAALSPAGRSFILLALTREQDERPCMADLVQHAWMQRYVDVPQ